ncbi:hypothetical protein BgiBS90_015069, partial [Biomphalaria glabrata]
SIKARNAHTPTPWTILKYHDKAYKSDLTPAEPQACVPNTGEENAKENSNKRSAISTTTTEAKKQMTSKSASLGTRAHKPLWCTQEKHHQEKQL